MTLLTSRGEVHQFIGLVNYYRNIWATISHTLAPLTELMSSKVRFNWNKIEQQVFEEIKQIVACNILLSYTDFNRELKINNDARRFQLGAVIVQYVKPITFYNKKLTGNQMR